MIEFQRIRNDDPVLTYSPIVRGILKTSDYIQENGGIGLTTSKAFKRNFVHWAAAEFDWPGFSESELFRYNKVLNEIDFFPLVYLHEMMTFLKIGRHYKGAFKLTRSGQNLISEPGKLFGVVTPFYLFHVNHDFMARQESRVEGNWRIFFNILNVEAENGMAVEELRNILYDEPDMSKGYDPVMSDLYVKVLRPLCWAGLLHEARTQEDYLRLNSVFTKTPLWYAALKLDTDRLVKRATRH